MSGRVILFLDGPHAGRFLLRYDPDYEHGRGLVESTPVLSEAKVFPDTIEAWEEWRRPSEVHPIRLTDGRPNRPMSAYSITVASVENAEEERALMTELRP